MALKILVCVRQVPCPETVESIPELGNVSEWRMNRYDEYALEAALQIRDTHPDTRVDALSVGNERVRESIRRAMAMGADAGIHIPFESGPFTDPATTANVISDYAKSAGYDLIFAGVMSEDAMRASVGPMIAGQIGLPCASAVVSVSLDPENRSVFAECEMESGWVETVRVKLPALLTIQTGNRPPRYPSLSNTLRARKQEIQTVNPASDIEVRSFAVPADGFVSETSECLFLEGTADEKSDALLRILAEKDLLR